LGFFYPKKSGHPVLATLLVKPLTSFSGANTFIRTINQLIDSFKKEVRDAKQLKAQRTQHLVHFWEG
jgi:hypothetical protein